MECRKTCETVEYLSSELKMSRRSHKRANNTINELGELVDNLRKAILSKNKLSIKEAFNEVAFKVPAYRLKIEDL